MQAQTENYDPEVAAAASAAAQTAMEQAAVAARLSAEAGQDDAEEERSARQKRTEAMIRVSVIVIRSYVIKECESE